MRRIILLITAVCWIAGLRAQTLTVSGTVKDESGEPLLGVSVTEKGTGTGVTTDDGGKYRLTVRSSSTLVFTYMGYKHTEEAVNGRTTIHVTLSPEAQSMDEVVVVGYGSVKRRDLTGSVASVGGDAIGQVPVPDITTALAGRASGVQVSTTEGAPGAGISIKIRGGGSITQSNEPLYVVDGFPQTDGLAFLDPMDIESIDILKDASATAIYGARGANGVVLVTTKKGKSGRTQVSYDMYYGAKTITNTIPMLSPYEYVLLEYEKSLDTPDELQRFTNRYGAFNELSSLYANRPGINWQDQLFGGTANTQYHKIAFQGGNAGTRFSLFYSRNNDDGIMVNSGATKNVAKLSLDHKANDRLTVSGSVNYTDQRIHGVGTSEGENRFNKLQNILQYRPTIGRAGNDDDLVQSDEDPALLDNQGNVLQNPLVNAIAETRIRNLKTLYMNASLDYRLLKNVSYKGIVGLRNTQTNAQLFNGSRSVNAKRTGGPNGSIGNTTGVDWNYSNTLTYDNDFSDHKLNVLVGQEQIYSKRDFVEASSRLFPNDDIGLNDLSLGALPGVPASFVEDEQMLSFFGRANYSFLDRYLLTASLRADGSSKFGSGNKFGYFPSAAFAWRAIEEDFVKQANLFSDLKLRLSYGQSGNNRISNYLSLALLESGYYPLNKVPVVSVGSRTLPNPNLKWEMTESVNIGLDLGFFNQRLQLTADLYNNRTKDLLLAAEVPYISGYSTVQMNVGSTRNRGLELSLNTINIVRSGFEWRTNLNITFNKNSVLELNDGQQFFYTSASYGALNESDYIVQVGDAVGKMLGYRSEGLYQVSDFDYNATTGAYTLKEGIPYDPNRAPQPGFLRLADLNNDGFITAEDRTVIGDANPQHFGGITNTFSYKGFDLSIFLNWVYGNNIYNANKLVNSQTHLSYNNTYQFTANRWITIDGNGNRVTAPDALQTLNAGKDVPVYSNAGDLRVYDTMIEDGSFLRINNISFGYNMPRQWLSAIKVNSLRLHATFYNLHTFTSYTGYDPEVSSRNSSGITPGVDFGAYPRSRSVVIGANVSF